MFDWSGFIIGTLSVLATITSVVALIVKSRGENKNTAATTKSALDARIDARVSAQLEEAWAEITQLKEDMKTVTTRQVRRDGAMTRILRAIAKQWPTPEGPDLDPADIIEVEETIPSSWIRKSRLAMGTGPTPKTKQS